MILGISLGIIANIVKEILAESVKGNALHEAGWDDSVGINVRPRYVNALA
jgi:hypothetical protein